MLTLISASARLNQYETGWHSPDFGMLQRLADMLNAPVEYFFTSDYDVAKLLIKNHLMGSAQKEEILSNLK